MGEPNFTRGFLKQHALSRFLRGPLTCIAPSYIAYGHKVLGEASRPYSSMKRLCMVLDRMQSPQQRLDSYFYSITLHKCYPERLLRKTFATTYTKLLLWQSESPWLLTTSICAEYGTLGRGFWNFWRPNDFLTRRTFVLSLRLVVHIAAIASTKWQANFRAS